MPHRTPHPDRRRFLGAVASSALGSVVTPRILRASDRAVPLPAWIRDPEAPSRNDTLQLALIGAGGMGQEDARTAEKIPGVKLVAICDVYRGRHDQVKERFENEHISYTEDHLEIAERDDIDAVILATPDHWHQRIAIDLLDAGKPVYCEKPMVQRLSQGAALIEAADRSGKTFQVGSQHLSSLGLEKARALYREGVIGELNFAQGYWARNTPWGAWQWGLPDDASEETVNWPRFLGPAPAVPFDPLRIFRWRCYRDYGTGVAGDLFVHFLSSLHFLLDSHGPERIQATGGLRFWEDGRDVPDFLLAMLDYPATDSHPAFNLSLGVNFMDGVSGETSLRLVGNEGILEVANRRVVLRRNRAWDPVGVFRDTPSDEIARIRAERPQMLPPPEAVWEAEEGYEGAYYDHMVHFLDGVRNGTPIVEDARYGMRAAGAALCCSLAHREGRAVAWDPEGMQRM